MTMNPIDTGMTDTSIKCPNCGTEIAVSEALGAQIRAELEQRLRNEGETRLKRAVAEAEQRTRGALDVELKDLQARVAEKARDAEAAAQRELDLRKKARALEEQQRQLAVQVRAQVEAELKARSEEQLKAAVTQAQARAREESGGELKLLQEQLTEQRKKVTAAQEAELVLRKEKAALEERQRELDLELQRRLDAAKGEIEAGVRQSLGEEHTLKLKEREKQIDDLRKALEDAKRKSEQGSQELQGEVLELDIQAELERLFPTDLLEPVAKGARGADIMQRVRNARLEDCGSIVWETKNTKHWQPLWLDKLKEDQRAAGGSIAVIVSVVLPDGIQGFGRLDGVWVSDLKSWPALAVALREQLIQVAFARSASEGKNEKMELLYRYLAGDEFRHRVEAIVETFTAMQAQLNRERRAMEKIWREREKQAQRIITNTVGMYGEMRGIIGATMPEIEALELEEVKRLEDTPE